MKNCPCCGAPQKKIVKTIKVLDEIRVREDRSGHHFVHVLVEHNGDQQYMHASILHSILFGEAIPIRNYNQAIINLARDLAGHTFTITVE